MSLVLTVHSQTKGMSQTPRNHESEIGEEFNFRSLLRDPQVSLSETLSSLVFQFLCAG